MNVRDFGAMGDGVTDDTLALRAAFAAVPDQGAHVHVPHGTYLVSGVLALKSDTYLKGEGPGSLFKRKSDSGDQIFLSDGVTGVTVESIAIDLNGAGHGQSKSFANGIAFRALEIPPPHHRIISCYNIRIRDITVFDSTGTTVLGRHAILALHCNDVWIEDNRVSHGLRIKAGGVGDRLVIRNNIVHEPNDNGITIATNEGKTVTANYIIQGNIVRAAKGTSIYIGKDTDPPGIDQVGVVYRNILIDGNILLGPVGPQQSMITVHLAGVTERVHIVNNVLENSGSLQQFTQGIESSIQDDTSKPGTDLLVAGNTVEGNFDHAGIWIRSWSQVRIVHNQISNGSANGIRLGAVDTATIQGNMVSNCATGIFVEDSTHLLATGNSLRELDLHGVRLRTSNSSKNTSIHFTANQVSGNAGIGVSEEGVGTFDTHYLFNDLRGNAGGALQNINSDATVTGNLT